MFLLSKAALSVLVLSIQPSELRAPASAQDPAPPPAQPAAARVEPKPAETEAALAAGLTWLVREQEADGSWSAAATARRCPEAFDKHSKQGGEYDIGLTGLAVLALARAHDAQGGRTTIDADAAFKKGVAWLVANQNDDGSIGKQRAFLYSQAMAARALVAACHLAQDPKVKEAAQKAVRFVGAAQRPSPVGKGLWGWRYASRQEVEKDSSHDDASLKELYDSDTSITGWCVNALRAARDAGLAVDAANLEGALEYIHWVSAGDGQVGYLDPKGAGATVTGKNDHFKYHPAAMSAMAALVRLDCGERRQDKAVAAEMGRVLADQPEVSSDHLSIDYYYWHHGVAALHRARTAGGDAWTSLAVSHLLALQDKAESERTRGAWLTGDRWAYAGGPLYTTALNALTLEDALDWD
jgi:hypothetical protein